MADLEVQTEPAEPTRIREIKANITAGLKHVKNGIGSKQDSRWNEWKRHGNYLRCEWDVEGKEKTAFHVNTVHSNYFTVQPNLIFKNPHITVTAKKPEFVRDDFSGEVVQDENGQPQIKSDNYIAAKMMEVRLNHELKQIRLKDIVKKCVGDNLAPYGIGWAQIGYQKMSVSGPNNDRDNKANYWLCRVDPRLVVYDWMATDIKEARWIAKQIIITRQEAEDNGFRVPDNYCGKLPEHLQEKYAESTGQGAESKNKGGSDELVVFWEYNDLVQNTFDWVLIDGPGEEWFFMKETSAEPYPFEGASLMPLVLSPTNDDIIGTSDVKPIEDQALALNRMRTREVHHMDNFGTVIVYEDGAITPANLDKNNKTPYGMALKIETGKFGKYEVKGTPSMGADHYNMSEVHKNDMQNTLGITDYQQGGSQIQRKATEAQIISTAANVRIEDKRDIISDFIIEIVRRLAAMIQEFDDELDFYNVSDEDLDDDFVETIKKEYGYNPKIPFLGISKDRIQGEFDFYFNVEDMIMQPKEVRAASLARTLQAVGSNDLLMKKFAEEYDTSKVISEMFELNGVDVKKFRKGGRDQIPAVIENEMFKQGKEVHEPHRSDNDDEHLITHNSLRRDLESEIQAISQQAQAIQSGMQMIPEMMAGNPEAMQVQQSANQKLNEVMMAIEPLEKQLRRLKLHMQDHITQSARKEGDDAMTGGAMGQQIGVPNAVAMGQAAQGPGPGTVV